MTGNATERNLETTLRSGVTFLEKAEENPCLDCSAPCCRLLLIPHPTPTNFMDMDYLRYMVSFEGVEMILTSDGHWQVLVDRTCRLLDPRANRCTVHGTSRKPKTCVFFNPHRCWYRRNFDKMTDPPDLIRISMPVLEAILPLIRFDAEGNITEIPAWELIREIAARLNRDTPPDSEEKRR